MPNEEENSDIQEERSPLKSLFFPDKPKTEIVEPEPQVKTSRQYDAPLVISEEVLPEDRELIIDKAELANVKPVTKKSDPYPKPSGVAKTASVHRNLTTTGETIIRGHVQRASGAK